MHPTATDVSVVHFGVFQADFRTGELRKKGIRVRLQEKPFRLLAALIEHPGDVVTRDELRRRLWGDQTFVDFERSLNIAITKLRAALGDSADSPRFIETLPRRGYRFIAPVTVDTPHARIPDSTQTGAPRRPPEAEAEGPVAVSESDQAAKQPTTRRPVRRRPMLIGALTVAALATVVFVVFSVGAQRAASGPPRFESLAVLPLENLSGDPDQEYLADGITDALITELGKIRTVRVISRTSILPYKGARKSLPDIGRELGVDAVVEGSVVRSGNRIRITAHLLEAASDRHLWAHAFERDVHDVVALYADVAEAIGREIHANIDRTATAAVRARPVDAEAWASYVRGRYLWEREGADNLKKARDYFKQAIDRQPDYALAYAGLADAYLLLAQNRVLTPTEAVPKAKEAALKALELDPSLAEGYTSLAGIACTFEADWSGAERAYRRAFEINPNYAIAHQWWGSTLAGLGRHAEAAVEMRKALEIDPVSLRVGQSAGRALYLARRYTEAVERYKKTLELNPNFVPALTGLGRVYIALGRKEQALAELERAATISDRAPTSLGPLGLAYGLFGDRNHALKILAELKDLSAHAYVSPLDYADVYLGLRDNDQVFRELHRAAEHQLSSLGSLKTSVEYDPLRTDPRFADLLRIVNLS